MSGADPDWGNTSYLATWILGPLALIFYPLQIITMLQQRRSIGVSFPAYVWSAMINTIFIVFAVLVVSWQGVILSILSVLLSICIILVKVRIERHHNLTEQTLLLYVASDLELADQCEWVFVPEHHHIIIKPKKDRPLYKQLGNKDIYISYIQQKNGTFKCDLVKNEFDHLSQAGTDVHAVPTSLSGLHDRVPPVLYGYDIFNRHGNAESEITATVESQQQAKQDDIKKQQELIAHLKRHHAQYSTHNHQQQQQQQSVKNNKIKDKSPIVIPPDHHDLEDPISNRMGASRERDAKDRKRNSTTSPASHSSEKKPRYTMNDDPTNNNHTYDLETVDL